MGEYFFYKNCWKILRTTRFFLIRVDQPLVLCLISIFF
jgi:hypothetical protein